MRRFTSLFPGMQGNGSIAEADESWRSRPPGLAPKSATTPPAVGLCFPGDVRRPAGGLSWNPRQRRIRAALKDAGQAWWAAANSAGR